MMNPLDYANADKTQRYPLFVPEEIDVRMSLNETREITVWATVGRHYQRTAAAWLACMDAYPEQVRRVLAQVYAGDAHLWVQRVFS